MTKRELLERLAEAPDDAPVFICALDSCFAGAIADIRLDDDEDHSIVIEAEPT